MKYLIIAACLVLSSMGYAFVLPDEIAVGISKSSIGESGGLYVSGVDRQRFLEYICSNWRIISDNIENLPESEGEFIERRAAFDSSVETFGAACEALPPLEYLDFLDTFIALRETGRISQRSFENQLSGSSKKQDFLEVNWQHPRVKTILADARKLIPSEKSDLIDWLDRISRGELADNYMTNKSDDAPFPETLPGIRLERPWGSLIRKYESATGKKVPDDKLEERWKEHDAQWRMRYEREKRGEKVGKEPKPPEEYEISYPFYALVSAVVAGVFALFWLWKVKLRKRIS